MGYEVEFKDTIETTRKIRTFDGKTYNASMLIHVTKEGKGKVDICLLESYPHFDTKTWEAIKECVDGLIEEAKRWRPMDLKEKK